jgi:hypothetical protein
MLGFLDFNCLTTEFDGKSFLRSNLKRCFSLFLNLPKRKMSFGAQKREKSQNWARFFFLSVWANMGIKQIWNFKWTVSRDGD